jgi:hypothetical protein
MVSADIWEEVNSEARYREVLYRALVFTQEEKPYDEVEAQVTEELSKSPAVAEAFTLIDRLVQVGGLTERWYERGSCLTAEEAALILEEGGTRAAELDLRLVTSPEGAEVVASMKVSVRLEELWEAKPQYRSLFLEVLDLCDIPRGLPEISRVLEQSPLVATYDDSEDKVYPAYFLDRLQEAGALEWKDGWVITDEGRSWREAYEMHMRGQE